MVSAQPLEGLETKHPGRQGSWRAAQVGDTWCVPPHLAAGRIKGCPHECPGRQQLGTCTCVSLPSPIQFFLLLILICIHPSTVINHNREQICFAESCECF